MLKIIVRKGCDYIRKDESCWSFGRCLMWFRRPICRVPPGKTVKVFVVQVRVRGSLILHWIKLDLAKCKEIDNLLTDENNLEVVKVKLTEITSLFQRFTDAHEKYNAALIDESQRQESVVYFADIESSLNFFCQTVNDWLRVTEIRIQDLDVTPDDSVSQLGLRNRKRSGCGSAYSPSSQASSISVARAKEAARIAELQAEVHALKQRQLIHET